jgi:hypothetical protein
MKGVKSVFRGVGKFVGSTMSTLMGTKSIVDAQKAATQQAYQQSVASYNQAQQQINAANAKEPDVDTIKADNTGSSATMLAGASGSTVDEAMKKKKTLLGGA